MGDSFEKIYTEIFEELKQSKAIANLPADDGESFIFQAVNFIHNLRIERVGRGYDGSSKWIAQRIESVKKERILESGVITLIEYEVEKHEEKILELLNKDNKRKQEEDIFYKLFSKEEDWVQEINAKFPTSGWKLHIYGMSLFDSFKIYTTLDRFLEKKKFGYKLATAKAYVNFNSKHFQDVQKGKACTVYIPMEYFLSEKMKKRLKKNIEEIRHILKKSGYSKKGKISGDKAYEEGIVHYRYEMSIPMLPEGFKDYHYYKDNKGGAYNIEGNPDLFEMLKT